MSQGNRSEDDPQSLTKGIYSKILEGVKNINSSSSSAPIYRVPEELRKLKKSAYTPRLVSIGPLHSKNKRLKSAMQDIKMSYVDALLCRMANGLPNRKIIVLEECVEAMKLLVEDAKKSYTQEVDNLNEEMLVVDGCFILELLYQYYFPKNLAENTNEERENNIRDLVFGNRLMCITVQHDLLLTENQLPLSVLDKLFQITMAKIPNHPLNYLLFHYVILYFSNLVRQEARSTTSSCFPGERAVDMESRENYNHILHMLHDHCVSLDSHDHCRPLVSRQDYSPLDSREQYLDRPKVDGLIMPSASNLDYAGVKFVAGTGQNLFKIKFTEAPSCLGRCFHRACFEIPTLYIYEFTEPFLRNFITFEQCYPNVSGYFTSYACLMNKLVNSAKDVEVLQKAGIIQNYLGTDQAASNLFNNLCKEVVLGEFYFAETCKQATEYSKRRWPTTRAHVIRKWFATPWTVIAFCIAFIVFVMSIAQFVMSIIQFIRNLPK